MITGLRSSGVLGIVNKLDGKPQQHLQKRPLSFTQERFELAVFHSPRVNQWIGFAMLRQNMSENLEKETVKITATVLEECITGENRSTSL